MFGHNDNQQQPGGNDQGNDSVLSAAMPDPISDTTLNAPSPTETNSGFPGGAPSVSSSTDLSTPITPTAPPADPNDMGSSSSNGSDDLISLKQQALQHLSPLVSHLNQTPEEKFRTTMMMIQASDDQSLLKAAFEAAQAITDDKSRAQALLDIINEINYFTQHQASK